MKQIDAPQRKHIFGLAKKLGKNIDDIRAIAKEVSGEPSISRLSYSQGNAVIRRLGGKINLSKSRQGSGWKEKKHGTGHRPAAPTAWPKDVSWLMSPGQRVLIIELLGELGWTFEAFINWIPKQFEFDHPGNKYQTSKVINRLMAVRKSDRERKKKKESETRSQNKK